MINSVEKSNSQKQGIPFFSVIVPAYNCEQYLAESLSSIESQTYGDFEVLIVYDDSKDGSLAICEDHAKKDGRIRIIRQKEKGIFMARVIGFDEAEGRYVVSVDSDDMIRNDALEILHKILADNDFDMVVFNSSGNEEFTPDPNWAKLKPNVISGKEEMIEYLLSSGIMNALWRKCIKNGCFMSMEEALECDYKHIGIGEDVILSFKPTDKCRKWIYLDDALYFHRSNPSSVTRSPARPEAWKRLKTLGEMTIDQAKKWDEEFNKSPYYEKMAKTKYLSGVAALVIGIRFPDAEGRKLISTFAAIRNDPFFLDIYINGNRKELSFKRRFLLRLLWKKHFRTIKLIRKFHK